MILQYWEGDQIHLNTEHEKDAYGDSSTWLQPANSLFYQIYSSTLIDLALTVVHHGYETEE